MKVYRVENKHGQGPFQGGLLTLPRHSAHYTSANGYPCPELDHGLARSSEDWEFCGVDSPEYLRYWFVYALKDLIAMKAKIVIYEVPSKHVTRGEYQVLFHHPTKIVAELPIEQLPVLE